MNKLVTIHEGKFPIDGRELHEKIKSKRDYSTWIKDKLEKCRFVEGRDFSTNLGKSTGGRPTIDYFLSIYAAKHLAMLENTDAGFAIRDYFIQIEEKWSSGETKQVMCMEDMMIAQLQSMKEIRLKVDQQGTALEQQANTLKQLAAKIETSPVEYYTIAGYASLRGIKVDIGKANLLGRKATKISAEYGVSVGRVRDPRFGQVNTYHLDILKETFAEYDSVGLSQYETMSDRRGTLIS